MESAYEYKSNRIKIGVINDPLGQTNSHASSEHGFRLKFVLFCEILKSGDGWTDNMCENNDHWLNNDPWLWGGRVNQYYYYVISLLIFFSN